MKNLLKFIDSQRLMSLASCDAGEVWIASVYVGSGKDGTIYFISPESAKHSQMVLKNPRVAFSFAWFDPKDYKNRKGVQGTGICRLAKDSKEIIKGLALLNAKIRVPKTIHA